MAQTQTTTTVATSTSTQTGTKLVVGSQSNTQTVGNFVTGVSIQPYIANRIVSFIAYNMRPNQRMHIFFDSVLVDQYCAPAQRDSSNNNPLSVTNTSDYNSIPKNGNWGTAIYSDSNGIVAGQFNIPEGTFKTGDRVLQISDVDSLVLGNSAYTTMSSAVFTASNLNVTKETVTLTTVNPELKYVPMTNTVVTTTTNVTVKKIPDSIKFTVESWEPIAQSLTINTPNDESGIFATSLDLFFKQKPIANTNGVMVYLCEMDNGYPNGNRILPFSTVHKNWNDINVSNDATSYTTFTFESPVFLANKNQYAFVVKPDSNDPDYYVWSANLGDLDVKSGYQVYSQPVIGTAFYGATTTEWTALQTEYIKFILNRASFDYATGTAVFKNSNTEYVSVYNVEYVNTSAGILPGDYVFQSSNSTVTTISNTGGVPNIYGTVDYYDSVKGILYLENTTRNFSNNSYLQVHRFANNNTSIITTPNTSTVVAWGNTGNLYAVGINALVPQLATISPPGTTLKVAYKGISNTYIEDAAEVVITPGYETEFFDKERIIASSTIEQAESKKSVVMNAYLTTDSEYVSPAIDTVRYQQLAIKNDVDPIGFNYDEFFSSSNTKSKYVSKIVTLAPGQDAEDLQVTLTAFRPYGSDIQVWFKILNSEDPDPITTKTWAPMYNTFPDLYSDPSNPNDFREFTFKIGSYYTMLATSGTVTVANNSTTVSGSSTLFTSEVNPGWYINMRASRQSIGGQEVYLQEQTRKVISVASDTQLTIDSAFIGNYSGIPYYIVPPPTTPWLSANTSTLLTGNVATSTTNNSIIGTGTLFDQQLKIGSIIGINGDSQVVVSISNSSHLTVGTPWSSTVTNASGYSISPVGATYLNNNLNLFSGIKQFQLKIILQSDDSSKVPILDDLRVLAMQL